MNVKANIILRILPIMIVWFCFGSVTVSPASGHRGVKRVMKNGNQVLLYAESHALVIGVSDYTGEWSSLPGVRQDIRDVKTVLEEHGFGMGKTEVTQGQWKTIMGNNPSGFKSGDNHPVETVSWHDAKKFVSTLNAKSGQAFQLPSEAQWEYAARSGGKDETYAGGNNWEQLAWFYKNSGGKTHPVGTKSPNGLGQYDMSGNVWEWCEDLYDDNSYAKHAGKNPVITSGGTSRVIRSGSWDYSPRLVRAADRNGNDPDVANSLIGFRLCAPRVR